MKIEIDVSGDMLARATERAEARKFTLEELTLFALRRELDRPFESLKRLYIRMKYDWWEAITDHCGKTPSEWIRSVIYTELIRAGYDVPPIDPSVVRSFPDGEGQAKGRDASKPVIQKLIVPESWFNAVDDMAGKGRRGHLVKTWMQQHLAAYELTPLRNYRD